MVYSLPSPLLMLTLIQLISRFTSLQSSLLDPNSSTSCDKIERKALLQFKAGLQDYSGRLNSWFGKDCCRWSGVGCNKLTGHVTKLDLRNPYDQPYHQNASLVAAFKVARLGGRINPSLLDLKYLNYLDLSLNNFKNTPIPNFIASLTELSYLNLSSASFGGSVPHHLGNLSNLQYLDLYSYPLKYSPSIWVSDLNWIVGLSLLKHLNLGYVNLRMASTSWLSVINMLPYLEELHLPDCTLDQVPYSLPFVNFSSIQVLDLSENWFGSSVPQWLFNISSSLVVLNLGNSGIGRYSVNDVDWGKFCHLQTLDLSSSEISGELEKFVSSLSKCDNISLEVLHLWSNNLGGLIPESLGHMKNLKSLRIDDNPISGSIPASIGNLSCLEELYVADNKLNGTIPESIGQLNKLRELYLEGNWYGVILETHFLHLENLKSLYFSSWNKALAFDIRRDWIPPFSLELIFISHCQMGPNFPAWLKTQKDLRSLSLEEVAISYTIPDWFWEQTPQFRNLRLYNNKLRGTLPKSLKFAPGAFAVDLSSNLFEGPLPLCSQVRILSLRNNSFTGSIPKNIGEKMWQMEYLDLSKNFLSGNIPPSIGKFIRLQIISLSNNLLSGKIPWWKSLTSLRVIDFSKNNLSGSIPSSICSHPRLHILKLSGNNLFGNLSSLQKCMELSELGLADNKFYGGIPKWIGERLSSLSILSLGGNMFNGKIPENLCHLSYLHILELRHNNLSGRIPPCLGNLSGLSYLRPYSPQDPGSHPAYWNEMEFNVKGRILEFTLTLDLVNIIDLSRNNLQGEIPKEITNLSTLGTLNLSWNQLTGNIPKKIGNLRSLETLDLSGNHLSGTIPSSMSDITALSHLNFSYNNLSGPIPSTNQFRTFNDPSIYEGNSKLCGYPLSTNCSTTNNGQQENQDAEGKDEDVAEMLWLYFYIGMAPGFVMGFWAVCGSLIISKSWRHALFRLVDDIRDRIWVISTVTLAHLIEKLKGKRNGDFQRK
ncbi:leucine-rich repeat receptor protein kinase EMS1-like [Durio zibethinus]|uniref:Leucine-rich repeat receptor protein kinase EMS1-like n=1 Tax=Durio zibethinus TaxID=66656 RepID=A0A6P6AH39_DURZI|nr:leucine-rich repeat receptor protein kinase EMS1-like [Durio zibethinus]